MVFLRTPIQAVQSLELSSEYQTGNALCSHCTMSPLYLALLQRCYKVFGTSLAHLLLI
jgi:hypothetical protein